MKRLGSIEFLSLIVILSRYHSRSQMCFKSRRMHLNASYFARNFHVWNTEVSLAIAMKHEWPDYIVKIYAKATKHYGRIRRKCSTVIIDNRQYNIMDDWLSKSFITSAGICIALIISCLLRISSDLFQTLPNVVRIAEFHYSANEVSKCFVQRI